MTKSFDHSDENELVPATSYVSEEQYERWCDEAEEQGQSVSAFIAAMVEAGINQIDAYENSPSEIIELRDEISQLQAERDELRRKLDSRQNRKYQTGMGMVKEIIIENPGITRREIVNKIISNAGEFVNEYLVALENSDFENRDGKWYPPEEVGDG